MRDARADARTVSTRVAPTTGTIDACRSRSAARTTSCVDARVEIVAKRLRATIGSPPFRHAALRDDANVRVARANEAPERALALAVRARRVERRETFGEGRFEERLVEPTHAPERESHFS